MSEEPQPNAGERAAGSDRRGPIPLRVLPDPDSPQGRAEALASAWARNAEQADWCVDASVALAAGCVSSDSGDSGVGAMSASERRAIHLTRQGVRARAILAAAEPGPEHERRERTRRWVIVIGSAVLHAVGFVVLASAVADLQAKPRPATHEHLFEAAVVVPIERAPVSFAPAKAEAQPQETPVAAKQPRPTPARKPSNVADAKPSEAKPSAPYELRGFELSSEGELASGEHGEGWGHRHGSGSGSGSGSGLGDNHDEGGAPREPAASKPDVLADPRGGLLQPEYPPELEREGVEGSVLIKVWIDEHGHVIKAEVVESSGEESFDHNAIMTAQRQEWSAAVQGGEAVASTRRYRVHFRLR